MYVCMHDMAHKKGEEAEVQGEDTQWWHVFFETLMPFFSSNTHTQQKDSGLLLFAADLITSAGLLLASIRSIHHITWRPWIRKPLFLFFGIHDHRNSNPLGFPLLQDEGWERRPIRQQLISIRRRLAPHERRRRVKQWRPLRLLPIRYVLCPFVSSHILGKVRVSRLLRPLQSGFHVWVIICGQQCSVEESAHV